MGAGMESGAESIPDGRRIGSAFHHGKRAREVSLSVFWQPRHPRNDDPWGGLWRFEFDRATIIAGLVNETYGLFRANGNQYQPLSAFADESMAFDKSFNHFHECVVNHATPWSSGADNLNSLSMVLDFIVSKPEKRDAEGGVRLPLTQDNFEALVSAVPTPPAGLRDAPACSSNHPCQQQGRFRGRRTWHGPSRR
jgi:hypothetical protein